MESKRILVMADIHGNYKALIQCLERSKFDYEKDILIQLGDVVDGHSQSFEVIEELLKIKNLISIKGNHDDWFNQWIETGINPTGWKQGQKATGMSYLKHSRPDVAWMVANEFLSGFEVSLKFIDIPESHKAFFRNQLPYYRDDENNLFIHAGFNRHYFLKEQEESVFWWDRDLWHAALSYKHVSSLTDDKIRFKMIENFKEVFIGHTTTQCWKVDTPMHAANIWNLDTGAGMYGKLTIMDFNTKEYWQSDTGKELYPEYTGRN